MKKVLIITYYWPPAGGPGVQRVLKFIKYLPDFGWQPIVLTIKNGEFQAIDYSFEKEIPNCAKIYKTDAIEPHKFYKKLSGMKKEDNVPFGVLMEKNAGWKKRLSFWFRVNVFIPDARIGWYPFALRQGKKIILNEKISLIFSSSPPPTVHLIAKKLAKWSGIKWVADLRDPWTQIYNNWNYKRFFLSEKIDMKLEMSVLTAATAITSVSQLDIKNDYNFKVPQKSKFYYIPNGYDEEDFKNINSCGLKNDLSNKINIAYLGSIDEERIPINLFKAIFELDKNSLINEKNFSINFIGKFCKSYFNKYIHKDIKKYIKISPYVPHDEVYKYLQKSTILLLLIYNFSNNIPGKTFEYLRSGKIILAFGPEDGEVAKLIDETKSGIVIGYNDYDKTYAFLEKIITELKRVVPTFSDSLENVKKHDRKYLTEKLVDIFNMSISNK